MSVCRCRLRRFARDPPGSGRPRNTRGGREPAWLHTFGAHDAWARAFQGSSLQHWSGPRLIFTVAALLNTLFLQGPFLLAKGRHPQHHNGEKSDDGGGGRQALYVVFVGWARSTRGRRGRQARFLVGAGGGGRARKASRLGGGGGGGVFRRRWGRARARPSESQLSASHITRSCRGTRCPPRRADRNGRTMRCFARIVKFG